MRVGTTLAGGAVGLSLALGAAIAQASPILLAEVTRSSFVKWTDAAAPSPGTVDFSYGIRLASSSVLGPALLTATYDAATPVPIVFDLTGAALATTIAALQDGAVHSYDFVSSGPARFDGLGPMRTVDSIFDLDLPDLTPYVIGVVRISLTSTCVRSVGAPCLPPFGSDPVFPNEIAAVVRMSIFSSDSGTAPVPEPGSLALLTTGTVGVLAVARRRRHSRR